MTQKLLWIEVDVFDPEYTVSSLIEQLQHYTEIYGDTAKIEHRRSQYSDDDYYYAVMVEVEETNEQYATRLIQEKLWADESSACERAEFQRLLAKFGPV